MGTALRGALDAAGVQTVGPLGRDQIAVAAAADVVLLCVPDGEIAAAAGALTLARAVDGVAEAGTGPLVGHCSGATGLDALRPHEAFSVHPLMTVIGDRDADARRLAACACAIAGATPRALQVAREVALAVGMRPTEIAEEDRCAYHAAATLASNFLVTLEGAAESLAARVGVSREQLLPLVQATVANWAAVGAEGALTGPIARGDETTVARQRAAIADRAPELLVLFDALCQATRELAARRDAGVAA
jgi:predicted short-subunit dehydrogenase-like oxidoreductase (DUF2520 family)